MCTVLLPPVGYPIAVNKYIISYWDHDSPGGIAIRHGLDDPGIDSQWGARFSIPVQTSSEAHTATYTMDTGSFPGVKQPGRGVDHPPHLAPKLKKV